MVDVVVWGTLKPLVGGEARLEIEADIAEAAEWYRNNYDFVTEAPPREF